MLYGLPLSLSLQARGDPAANIQVLNLPLNLTKHQLYCLFSEYGNILSTSIITDKLGTSKGVGFVQFEKVEEALKAVKEMHGTFVNKFLITVRV